MKKRLLILSSLITLLLTCFSLPIYADEDPTDPTSSVPVPNSIRLDQYFFDNYDLLPYITSTGSEYINTGVNGTSDLRIELSAFNIGPGTIFGSRVAAYDNDLSLLINDSNSNYRFIFNNVANTTSLSFGIYQHFNIVADKNNLNINGLSSSVTYSEFSNNLPLYIFANNNNGSPALLGHISLEYLRIYDYDSGSYVRYYYPARSKAGGVIGLYDAVSDTFVTTSGNVPFASPIPDQVLNLQIGNLVISSLGWITDILEFAITTPIILVFMAIGLAGVMFRWGRRLVHF